MSAARHIALVLHDFPAGGTERIAIRLCNLWAARGRRVSILCGSEAGPARQTVDGEVTVARTQPEIARSRGSRGRLGAALAPLIRDLVPDVLVGPGNFHLPVLAALAGALGRDRPAIVCKFSNPLRRPDRGWLGQRLFEFRLRRMVRPIDRLAAMSESLAREAIGILGPEKIRIVPGPNLPAPPLAPARDPARPLVLAAGRMVAQKYFALTIRAFAMLDDQRARLVLLGDGPERKRLELLAVSLSLGKRVTFAGHVPDIAPWLARADALLLTSRYEGYPSVLIEAIAAGVPVVTTPSSPAIAEIVADLRSGVVAPAEPARLAAALAQMLASEGPPESERDRLRARHAPEAAADAWLALLDETVANRAG